MGHFGHRLNKYGALPQVKLKEKGCQLIFIAMEPYSKMSTDRRASLGEEIWISHRSHCETSRPCPIITWT